MREVAYFLVRVERALCARSYIFTGTRAAMRAFTWVSCCYSWGCYRARHVTTEWGREVWVLKQEEQLSSVGGCCKEQVDDDAPATTSTGNTMEVIQ